jgi:hypothetical protein
MLSSTNNEFDKFKYFQILYLHSILSAQVDFNFGFISIILVLVYHLTCKINVYLIITTQYIVVILQYSIVI